MRSLASKTIALFLAASLPPLLGAGAAVFVVTRDAVRRDAQARQGAAGRAAARVVEDYLDRARAKLRSLAALLSSDVADGSGAEDPATVARRLDGLVDPADLFLELNFVAAAPTPNLLAQRRSPATNVEAQMAFGSPLPVGEPALRNALTGEEWIAPSVTREGGSAYLDLSTSVRVGGAVNGALAARLDVAPLDRLLAALASEQGFDFSLGHGAPCALREREGVLELAVPAGHADWTVIVARDRRAAFAPVDRIARQTLLWLGLGAALASALGWAFTRGLLRPIRALHRASAALARGERATRVASVRADEIGELARAFDGMAESLAKLDSMKDEFVAHVSHELRTPLTSAKMSLGNLRDGIAGPVSPHQEQVLDRVKADLDRLLGMVNELLHLARLEGGEIRLARESTDLRALVASCLADLAPVAEGRTFSVDGEGRALVDPARFRQVALNLVENGFRHGTDSVRVEVGPGSLRVFSEGPPIPEERRRRLFERFTPSSAGGAGLGLAIARKIVELHGGSIRHDPAPGGNLFTVEIPAAPDTPARPG